MNKISLLAVAMVMILSDKRQLRRRRAYDQ